MGMVTGQTIGLTELQQSLANASRNIEADSARIVQDTARKIAATQRRLVAKRSHKTERSIRATGPRGRPFTPTTTEAEIGPTWFVGRLLEYGTVHMTPRPFVEHSADPHMAEHRRKLAQAAISRITGGRQ